MAKKKNRPHKSVTAEKRDLVVATDRLDNAISYESARRFRLTNARTLQAKARAWMFRMLLLAVVLFFCDVAFALFGRGNTALEVGAMLLVLSGVLLNFGVGMHATHELSRNRELHDAAVTDLIKAQLALDVAQIAADIEASGVAPTDLDNLE